MRGLNANFEFTSAQWGHWRKTPVCRLEGGWRTPQLAALLPEQRDAIEQGKPADASRLPEQLARPRGALRRAGRPVSLSPGISPRGVAQGERSESEGEDGRAIVTLELFDVVLNGPIEPERFLYNPGSVDPHDMTESFLQSLGVKE